MEKTPYQGQIAHFISGDGVGFVGEVAPGPFPGWIRLKNAAQTQLYKTKDGGVGVRVAKISGGQNEYRAYIDLNVSHFQQVRILNTETEFYRTYKQEVTGLTMPSGRQISEVARG
jgi:hypothetical protein